MVLGQLQRTLKKEDVMADVIKKYDEDCACEPDCPTSATITEWSCGCVEVEIHNDTPQCTGCSDFSGMRESCGKSGHPGG